MPSRARVDYRGRELIENVRAAARIAVNETVDAARDDAKATHDPEWVNRPTRWSKEGGQLEEEIVSKHADPASQKIGGPNPSGSFGFTKKRGFVGLFHEEGTVHERIKPVLRPSADRIFPTLLERIRRRLARG
jgi:hypothetical protein